MSALLLNYPKRPHELPDDLESFVHVIDWLTLRYHKQWPNRKGLSNHLFTMYEETSRSADWFDVGSNTKLQSMWSGTPGFDLNGLKPEALRVLIHKLAELCQKHYSSLDYEKDMKPYLPNEPFNSTEPATPVNPLPRYTRGSSRADAPAIPPKPKGPSVCKDHSEICSVFSAVASADLEVFWNGKKLYDQFVDLPPAGAVMSASYSSSSKRSSQNVGSSEGPGKKKKTDRSSRSAQLSSGGTKVASSILV